MKLIILSLFFVCCVQSMTLFDSELDSTWEEYKQYHSKEYSTKQEENGRRLKWEHNLKYIRKHNLEASLGHHSYTLAMNQFGDMTNDEFRALYNGYNRTGSMQKKKGHSYLKASNVQIPDAVDWRTKGFVTPVKDQGQCGSCWAFSAVASLEGQHFKQSGKLVSLSEQNLVDCSRNQGNQGCYGGLMDQAFQYIKVNGGIDTEHSYPYEGFDNKCRFKKEDIGATDTGFVDIESGSEEDLTDAVATVGPISVAIDASHDSFQFYEFGIYDEFACSKTELDHGVTVVGYGADHKIDYYIVKNSWGRGWGMNGYILMRRNWSNMCGIATQASYPLV